MSTDLWILETVLEELCAGDYCQEGQSSSDAAGRQTLASGFNDLIMSSYHQENTTARSDRGVKDEEIKQDVGNESVTDPK